MFKTIKNLLMVVLPYLKIAANLLLDADTNETGFDDKLGQFLVFVIEAITAILNEDETAFDNAKNAFANDALQMPVEPVI